MFEKIKFEKVYDTWGLAQIIFVPLETAGCKCESGITTPTLATKGTHQKGGIPSEK